MKSRRNNTYIKTLRRELVPALGCTEPIAIAYAAAKARQVLGTMPETIDIRCSGNIVKNVKAVTVPNSNGLKGIDVAAALGVIGGNAARELEVLEEVTAEHIEAAKEFIAQGRVTCSLQEDVANLYIVATVKTGEHSAQVTLINRHTFITEIRSDNRIVYQAQEENTTAEPENWDDWSVAEILDFAETVDLELVKDILDRQIEMNTAIADAGLSLEFGSQVGRTLLDTYGERVSVRAKARAAAGSDARMSGCSLPVVINSGSGNQGMTVSLPVIEYAKELNLPQDKLYRALLISNLLSVYQKHFIGSLSAFCGAVTAACASGAAIVYLKGGNYEQISQTIVNTLGNVGGIVCDGAKASCAAKIASSLDAAIMAGDLSLKGLGFHGGEGFIQDDVDMTIRSNGYLGRVGMKSTDVAILNIMLDKVAL